MSESSSSSHVPTRSVSLPPRLIHPKAQRVEEEMKKIQALNSSSRIQLGLSRLVELYDFVNEQVIYSPQGQQALRLSHNTKLVEDALDESVLLLDVSDFTRDLIGTFMEQIEDLQSTLRRRGGDLSIIHSEIRAYITIQKKFKNAAARQLKSLERTQIKKKSPVVKRSGDLDQHYSMVSNILRQSNISTISVLQSLLQFLSSSSKNQKKEGEIGCVENSMIRSFYGRIIGKKVVKVIESKKMLGRLAMLNVSLEAVKNELSYLSRRLIQHRVSLLNTVTP